MPGVPPKTNTHLFAESLHFMTCSSGQPKALHRCSAGGARPAGGAGAHTAAVRRLRHAEPRPDAKFFRGMVISIENLKITHEFV